MGGSSSSSTNQTSQQDNRVVQGQGAVLAQGGSSIVINTADAGIVSRALDTVDRTNVSMAAIASNANSQAAAAVSQATDALAAAYSDAKGNNNKGTITIAAVVVAGMVAMQYFGKK